MVAPIRIAGRDIGDGHPAYIVAELSANHCGEFEKAAAIVHAAKAAGADAVKLQTYTPDTITLRSDAEQFRVKSGTLWDGRLLHELYEEAMTPWEWQPRLKTIADEIGIHLFSAPFDETAVDFLEKMGVPAHKVASFELVHLPLIRKIARTGKPMIMSTGMATIGEIGEAVAAAREAGARQIALLKCTSSYPAPPEESNLATIPHLREAFGLPVGLSDHTLGIAMPVAAVALGACIIEKHLILSRDHPSADAKFSLEPAEFKAMVEAVRDSERGVGVVTYGGTANEDASRGFRRSVFVVEDVRAGEPFTERNLRVIRPANGLHPRYYEQVLGKTASKDVKRGTPFSWDLVGA